MRGKMAKSEKSDAVMARDKRKEMSLAGWREHGTRDGAAKACGRCINTIAAWWRDDAEYRAAVNDAIEEYANTAGRETHNALVEHVRSAQRGDMVVTKRGIEGGKPVEIEERVALNPALARLILTRADPRFTHPKQEMEHSGKLEVQAALDEVDERLVEHDAQEVGALPEPPQASSKGGASAAALDEALDA